LEDEQREENIPKTKLDKVAVVTSHAATHNEKEAMHMRPTVEGMTWNYARVCLGLDIEIGRTMAVSAGGGHQRSFAGGLADRVTAGI
jgi:hypothetical protein